MSLLQASEAQPPFPHPALWPLRAFLGNPAWNSTSTRGLQDHFLMAQPFCNSRVAALLAGFLLQHWNSQPASAATHLLGRPPGLEKRAGENCGQRLPAGDSGPEGGQGSTGRLQSSSRIQLDGASGVLTLV